MAITLIRNIESILTINPTYTYSDLIAYMNVGSTISTTEIYMISAGRGVQIGYGPFEGIYPGASYGGNFYGSKTTTLSTTVTDAILIIEAPAGALATWPSQGYVWATPEAFYYSSINPSTTSASGNDEFVIPAGSGGRGWVGTASAHTAGVTLYEVLPYFVKDITRDVDAAIYNIDYSAGEWINVNYVYNTQTKQFSDQRSVSANLIDAYQVRQESDV
jgi:hypothetical protein|tara:strand:- start:1726 stop:2379 length:654 start_codon:yes stop_codon:yes gene_type:complete